MYRQDSFAMQDNEEDEVSLQPSRKSESDEEDYESFFLQPASCPYNIKDKILEANAQLLQESLNESKQIRIQFRPNLVDFEPDLTDDDVQSIESYSEEVINVNEELKYVLDNTLCNIIEEEIIEESIFETIIALNHQKQCEEEAEQEEEQDYSSPDETDEIPEEDNIGEVDDIEEIEDIKEVNLEVSESIDDNNLDDIDDIIDECPAVPLENPTPTEVDKINNLSSSQETISESLPSKQVSQIVKHKNLKKRCMPHEINCKKHCIEELESRLDMCINRLRLNEKVSKPLCPTLRLHRQKCCSAGCKTEQKLPIYTGAHSEYGLSSTQIERLAKRKKTTKLKTEKKRELTEAYRRRKIQQNEIIFRQWLKDISTRQHTERCRQKEIIRQTDSRITRGKQKHYSYSSGDSTQRTTARIDSKEKQEKLEHVKQQQEQRQKHHNGLKPRPKTANCITNLQLSSAEEGKTTLTKKKKKMRARPHTTSSSTARIYIEIPERLLDEGISLGELFLKQLDLNEKTKPKERLQMVTKVKSRRTEL